MTGAGGMPTLRNQMSHNMALVERMREIANRHKRSVGEVAIAWTLRHPVVTGAIVGARNAKQVEEMMGAPDFRLSEVEIMEIEEGETVPVT